MQLEKDIGQAPFQDSDVSAEAELQRARERLAEIHAWRRRLHPRYHGTPEIEAALDVFSDAFIRIAEGFDITVPPARQFLEKARGARELSRKGAEIADMKKRFRISPRMLADSQAYLVRAWEAEPRGFSGADVVKKDCHLDAPFGYALEFENEGGKWEVIALAAALPDFDKKTLLIKELQGSGGIKRLTVEAQRVRAKFNTATCVPFMAMAVLAKEAGLTTTSMVNAPAWRQKEEIADSINSAYVQIPRRFHMEPSGDYFSIETQKLLEE